VKSTNKPLKIVGWLLSYLRPFKWAFLFVVFLGVVTNGIELIIPIAIEYFIDVVLPLASRERLLLLTAVLALLIAVMLISRTLESIKQKQIGEKAAGQIQLAVLQQLRTLGFSYFERHPVGESLALVNTEVSIIQELYRDLLPNVMNSTIFCIIAVVMMVTIDWRILLLLIPLILLYTSIGPRFERKAALTVKDLADSRVRFNQKIYESFSAAREIKVNNAIEWEEERIHEKQRIYHQWLLRNIAYAFIRGGFRRVIVAIGGIGLFLYGFWAVRGGLLTVGEITALILYFNFSMLEITYLITGITELRLVVHQAEKLFDFMHTEPAVKPPKNPVRLSEVKGEITFENVRFGYAPDKPVLKGISFNIRPGERVAFVGPSGNGKSTILKLIGRFYDPQGGVIRLDGVPIERLSLEQLRNSIGYVFQETYLFGLTVMENIRFGNPDADDEAVYRAAKLANAHDFILELPQGYNTHVGEKGVLLSGGQRQRIAIARMLLKDPAILIMDEPTSSLDNISEREIQQALDALTRGRTVITVTHRLSTIQNYDVAYIVRDGVVVGRYTPNELRRMDIG